jgi:hypothetical protein
VTAISHRQVLLSLVSRITLRSENGKWLDPAFSAIFYALVAIRMSRAFKAAHE